MSLFAELKRRNVFRVGIAYLAAMWLIAQVLQLIVDSFDAPAGVMRTVLMLMAAGLPLVLLFAWAFELTPEGLKREHQVDRSKSITARTGSKLDRIIIVVLALALAYFVFDKFALSPDLQADPLPMTSTSIAVMPFVNLSSDAEQAYFSDGLSEELLNLLAKIPELRVTSRSSAFSLRDEELDIPTIADKLNVAHVLEGSVRKSGNQIRVTAQLIDAKQDRHLWSQTYERALDDIFVIQDEIASSVVGELQLALLGTAPKAEVVDSEAYSLYLQARHLAYRNTADAWETSSALYRQALDIDPDYVAALSGLAGNVRAQSARMVGPLAISDGSSEAKKLARQALAIDPNHAEAHAVLGQIALDGRNLQEAARHFEKATALAPTNDGILLEAVSLVSDLGRREESLAILEYLVARDPLNPRALWRLGYAYEVAGRWREAREIFKRAVLLSPDMGVTKMAIGFTLLMQDDPDPEAALEWIEQDSNTGWRLVGLALANHDLGLTEESDAAVAELIDNYESESSYNIAAAYAYRNEADRAFEWLDKAEAHDDPGLSEIGRQAFFFENIHDDPRWLPFLERIGMSPDQHAAIEFSLSLPQ